MHWAKKQHKGPLVEQARPLGEAVRRPGQRELGEERMWGEGKFWEEFRAGLGLSGHMEEIGFDCERAGGPGDGFEHWAAEVSDRMM